MHVGRRDIKRLPGQLATNLLAEADDLRFQRTCSRPAGFRFVAGHGMWHAMHMNTGYARCIRAHVGMQKRRHALQQGEQRYQDRMADFHKSIIENESFTPLTWRKLRYAPAPGHLDPPPAKLRPRVRRWP